MRAGGLGRFRPPCPHPTVPGFRHSSGGCLAAALQPHGGVSRGRRRDLRRPWTRPARARPLSTRAVEASVTWTSWREDLGSSSLFAGVYEPTYAGRAARLRRLAAAPRSATELPPLPLEAFADRVASCTAFKLQGGEYREEADGVFWRDAIAYARLLWRWELRRLTGSTEGLSDRELIWAWMRRQSLHCKFRGWASFLRRCGGARSWRCWPRWVRLAAVGTPRYWVYAAAAELCFGLLEEQAGKQPDWKELQSWLPLVDTRDSRPPGSRELCREVAANYERFLETTCA